MSATQSFQPQFHSANSGVGFGNLFIALVKRKGLVISLPIVFAIFAAVVMPFIPNHYKATTKILPRQPSQSNAAAMLNQLQGLAGFPGGSLSVQIPIDPNAKLPIELVVSMLKSESVAEKLVQRFDLKKAYSTDSVWAAQQALAQNSTIKAGRDGLITIDVEDKNSKRAAQIANAYVEELVRLASKLALTESSQHRFYFERQLHSSKDKLTKAVIALKEVRGGGNVPAAVSSHIENMARLRAQVAAKEIQLSATQAFEGLDNREYSQGQQELANMRTQLAKLESPRVSLSGIGESTRQQGDAAFAKVLGDVKYYESLSNLLQKQYENAVLEEEKDISIVQVMDKAKEPEYVSSPKRGAIVGIVALIGVFSAILWVLLFDVIRIKAFFKGANT